MNDHLRMVLRIPVKSPIEYWDKYWHYFTEKLCDKDNFEVTFDSIIASIKG